MQALENEKVVLFSKHSGSQELFEFVIVRTNAKLIFQPLLSCTQYIHEGSGLRFLVL